MVKRLQFDERRDRVFVFWIVYFKKAIKIIPIGYKDLDYHYFYSLFIFERRNLGIVMVTTTSFNTIRSQANTKTTTDISSQNKQFHTKKITTNHIQQ